MSSRLKAAVAALAAVGIVVLLADVAMLMGYLQTTPLAFDPVDMILVGAVFLFTALVLEVQRRRELPERGPVPLDSGLGTSGSD